MAALRILQTIGAVVGSTLVLGPAIAAERCNPPHRTCGEGSLTYPCPPCPPGGIAMRSLGALEDFRESLEAYRESLEATERNDRDGSLVDYRHGIDQYREGISVYRDAVGEAGPEAHQ